MQGVSLRCNIFSTGNPDQYTMKQFIPEYSNCNNKILRFINRRSFCKRNLIDCQFRFIHNQLSEAIWRNEQKNEIVRETVIKIIKKESSLLRVTLQEFLKSKTLYYLKYRYRRPVKVLP